MNEVRFRELQYRATSVISQIAIALDQLNHVAEALSKKLERRLVLIFNNVHYFHHTSQGRNVLLQLQQVLSRKRVTSRTRRATHLRLELAPDAVLLVGLDDDVEVVEVLDDEPTA